ncbi:MAG: hypothetical protein AB9921_08775 [Erysipelotrichaceae bacterium]
MKTKLTELVFILDRSGSMSGLESDTIGGFNAMLKKQKEEPGDALVTTVLFDDVMELLHDRYDIKKVNPVTEKEYFVRGSTALLDAIGKTIHRLGNVQKYAAENLKADKVIVVITTDGMENASNEYSYKRVQEMITRQKEKYGWEFIFLGANIDAIATAARFGIDADHTSNYHADTVGMANTFDAMNEFVVNSRNDKEFDVNWKAKVEEDFKKRNKGN